MLEVQVSAECQRADQAETYYTPCRVRVLLQLYHYLHLSRPPGDLEMEKLSQQVFGPGGWQEEAQGKRVDLAGAVLALMGVDHELYEAVAGFADGESMRITAAWMGVSETTARERRDEAIWWISRHLGYRADCCRSGLKCPPRRYQQN